MLKKFQAVLKQLTPPVELFMCKKDKDITFPLITAYADDISFLSTSLTDLQRMYPFFVSVLAEFGFTINVSKTVLLLRSPDQQLHQALGDHCQFGNAQIPVRRQVIILGTRINANMNRRNQIVERLNKALPVYYSLLRNLKDQKLPYEVLVRLYRATLVPIMTYGLRPISFTKGNRQLIKRREVMMLRGLANIACPPPHHKLKLFTILHGKTINRTVQTGRIHYFAHVSRSQQRSLIRKSFNYKLTTKRKHGRPCYTFEDTIIKEIDAIPFATEHALIDAFKISSETKKLCQIIYATTHNDLDPVPTTVTLALTLSENDEPFN